MGTYTYTRGGEGRIASCPMKRIITLTMNAAIEVAYEMDRVFHTQDADAAGTL